MSRFGRTGHWRTNANGTTFYVREHMVYRDHWDINALRLNHFGQKVYYASDFLRRNNVGLGKQGCFVNPNARCPVCSKPVFFYSNQYGSRVYFDDLGPPWPKHPCTDNPVRKIVDSQNWGAISKRPKGLTIELIENANIAGLFHRKEYGQRKIGEWTLLLIEEVLRDQKKNILKAIFLDSGTGEKLQITCFSNEPIFKEHDLLAWNGSLFSFILRDKLAEVVFHDGGPIESRETSLPKEEAIQPTNKTFDLNVFSLQNWNDVDIKHFRSKNNNSIHFFLEKYRPVIKRYIENKLITSEQIALALGKERFRTAVGAQWSPQLVEFLVYFIFNGTGNINTAKHRELREDEMHHFHTKRMPINRFIEQMKIKLASANKSGKFSDAAVSNYFNKKRILTASGDRWSSHLVRYLKAIIAHDTVLKDYERPAKGNLKTNLKTETIDVGFEELSNALETELMKKLSKLGVVRLKHK